MNAALATLSKMRLPDDVRQTACELVLRGKPLDIAIRHARAQAARDSRPSGFVSLDERADEGDFGLHEKVAAADPSDFFDHIKKSKSHQFDPQTESVLLPLGNGAAALGRALNRTGRRGQQIVRAQIQRAAGEFEFRGGGKGQGGLFGFDGVAPDMALAGGANE